jgi:hypothetical protein
MKWPPLLFTVYMLYIVPRRVVIAGRIQYLLIYLSREREGLNAYLVLPTHILSLHDIKKFCNYLIARLIDMSPPLLNLQRE